MNSIQYRSWGRVTRRSNKRTTIKKCLSIIGMDKQRIYLVQQWLVRHGTNHACKKYESFWDKDEYELRDIADDMKRIFHARLKKVGHEFTENHAEASALISAYRQAVKLFAAHGIKV